MAITGQGAASKEQVASILCKILAIEMESISLDATDALAAALCHFYQDKTIKTTGSYRGWDDFLKKNPGRAVLTNHSPDDATDKIIHLRDSRCPAITATPIKY